MRESHTRLLDYGRVSCRSTERTSGQTKVVGSHHNPILVLNGEDGCTCYYRLSSKSSAKSRLVVNRRRTVCAGHPRRKCQLRLDVGGWDMSRMGQRHHCAMTSQTRGITEKCLRTYRAAPVCRKVVHGRRCWEELWSESREPDASSETFTVRASCTFAHVTSHTYNDTFSKVAQIGVASAAVLLPSLPFLFLQHHLRILSWPPTIHTHARPRSRGTWEQIILSLASSREKSPLPRFKRP